MTILLCEACRESFNTESEMDLGNLVRHVDNCGGMLIIIGPESYA